MVLRQALEQVRIRDAQALERIRRPAPASETGDFADNVEAWIRGDNSRKVAILDFLSTHGRIDETPAHCEEASREFGVCHVNYGRNGDLWLEIDEGGNVLDL